MDARPVRHFSGRFWGTGPGATFRGLWALLLVVAAFSRFGLRAAGPWEQDEALLAAGVLDFDPNQHMPHPPGFPLWVWVGRLLLALGVGDPLGALQLASAGFSVLSLVALRYLAEPLLGPRLAMAAVWLAAFLPGVWFHAVRGFSETPSAAVFLAALALWTRGRDRWPVLALVLLTAAALIRPPLAPFYAVVGLSWVWNLRSRARVLVEALGASLVLVLVSLGPLILEAGGWHLYWESFSTHAGEHVFLLGSEGARWEELGWVRGLGGPYLAIGVTLVAVVGWGSLARTLGRPRWLEVSGLGLWLVYLLSFTHNRTYPRYWVLPFLLAAIPVVAGLRWVLRREWLALVASLALGAALAAWAYPAVSYTHRNVSPPVAAFLQAANDPENTVVFQDELFSFRNYLARTKQLECRTLRFSEVQAPQFRLGGSKLFLVSERAPTFLPSSVSVASRYRVVSPQARVLSQGRFLEAVAVANPVMVFAGGSVLEFENRDPFVWLYPHATLLLPAVAGSGQVTLAVELPPDLPQTEVEASLDSTPVLKQRLDNGRRLLTVPIPELPHRLEGGKVVPLTLRTTHFRKYHGDFRPLALKVSFVSLEAPPWQPLPYQVIPEEQQMHRRTVTAEGLFGYEEFPAAPGAWCQPRCSWQLPLGPGRVGLWVSAPRPGGAQLVAELGVNRAQVAVPPEPIYLELPIPHEVRFASRLDLRFSASAYQPPRDPRQLGFVIHQLAFVPGVPLLEPPGSRLQADPTR